MGERVKDGDVSTCRPYDVSDATDVLKQDTCPTVVRPTFSTWFVVLCGSVNFGLALGLPVSLSVMFVDWQDAFRVSRARTAAVHSTCVGILFAGGVFAGFLVNRFGARFTLLLGSFLAFLGLFLSVFANSIDYLTVTIGVVAGSGFCLLQLPCIPCVTQVVTRCTSLAISLCTFGASVFSLILPHFYRELVHHFGWRGSYFIISGLALNTCVTGLVMTSSVSSSVSSSQKTTLILVEIKDDSSDDQGHNSGSGVNTAVTEKVTCSLDTSSPVLQHHADNSESSQLLVRRASYSDISSLPEQDTTSYSDKADDPDSTELSKSFTSEQTDRAKSEPDDSPEFSLLQPEVSGSHVKDTGTASSKCAQLLQRLRTTKWRFIVDPLFLFCLLFLGLTLGTLFSFSLLLMDFAKTRGFEEESVGVLFILVTVMASTAGRILAGLLNLIPTIHSFYILCVCGCLGSAAMIVLANITGYVGILVCLVMTGLGQGGIVGIYPKCILDLDTITTESYPLAFGVACSFEGFFDVVIPIVTGHMVDVTGSYFLPLLIQGSIGHLVSVMLAVVFFVRQRKQTKDPSDGIM